MSYNNKQIMARNIKHYMELKGVTNQQLCDALGFKYTTFMDWIKGKTFPRIGKVEAMANYFGCEKSDLIEDKRTFSSSFNLYSIKNIIPLPETKKIPLLGSIACGEPILAEENIVDLIEIPKGVNATFALTCHGDSMTGARIMDGDIVYIHEQPDVENGQIAAVLIGDEATLKKVYKYPNMLVLRPENPAYEEMVYQDNDLDKVKIIGLAVSFHSAVRHHK